MSAKPMVIKRSNGRHFIVMGKGTYKNEEDLIILRNGTFPDVYCVVKQSDFVKDYKWTNQEVYES